MLGLVVERGAAAYMITSIDYDFILPFFFFLPFGYSFTGCTIIQGFLIYIFSIHQNNNIKVIKKKKATNLTSVGREWFH